MAIIVTGVSGHLGSLIAEALTRSVAPEDLILVTRAPEALSAELQRSADVRYGDFDDPASLRSAFAGGTEMLLISTTQVGERRRSQHRNAIDQAASGGVRRVVYTSSVGIHPLNPCFVIPDHIYTEDLLNRSGLEVTLLRMSSYSERAALFAAPEAIRSGKWISLCGDGKFAPVSKYDCAETAAAAVTNPGHAGATYEITGPDLVSLRDAAALAARISGRPIEYVARDLPRERTGGGQAKQLAAQQFRQAESSIGPYSFNDLESYELAVRAGYYAICTRHVDFITGRPARTLEAVFRSHLPRELIADGAGGLNGQHRPLGND